MSRVANAAKSARKVNSDTFPARKERSASSSIGEAA
jgi:hypothetical protein